MDEKKKTATIMMKPLGKKTPTLWGYLPCSKPFVCSFQNHFGQERHVFKLSFASPFICSAASPLQNAPIDGWQHSSHPRDLNLLYLMVLFWKSGVALADGGKTLLDYAYAQKSSLALLPPIQPGHQSDPKKHHSQHTCIRCALHRHALAVLPLLLLTVL